MMQDGVQNPLPLKILAHAVPGAPQAVAPLTVFVDEAARQSPRVRGEDFGPDGKSSDTGSALTTWSSFVLRPRNLFDSTPLYRP